MWPISGRLTTNTIRGVAALSVIANHYLNEFVPGNQVGFANAIVSVFFLLSGYGIFVSLDRKFPESTGLKWLPQFYARRILRLLPGAVALGCIAVALGGPFLASATGIMDKWFIAAILQCYVLAPFLYLLIRRFPRAVVGAFATLAVVGYTLYLTDAFPPALLTWLGNYHLIYREIPLGHCAVFSLGMVLARNGSVLHSSRSGNWGGVLAFILVLMVLAILKVLTFADQLTWAGQAFQVGSLFPVLLFALLAMKRGWGSYPLAIIGMASLPIYLFNGVLNSATAEIASGYSVVVTSLMFIPLDASFVLCCVAFQCLSDIGLRRLSALLSLLLS